MKSTNKIDRTDLITEKYCEEQLNELLNSDDFIQELNSALPSNNDGSGIFDELLSADIDTESRRFEIMLRKSKERQQRRYIIRRVVSVGIAAAIVAVSFLIYSKFNSEVTNNSETMLSVNSSFDKPTIVINNKRSIDISSVGVMIDDEISVNSEESIADYSIVAQVESPKESVEYHTAIIPSRYKWEIRLSDGTVVHLNANSKLTYPNKFIGDTREVTLEGEGYFDVAKSTKRFIVKTDGCDISVYGTEFNVNTNKSSKIETTLIEGSVKVTANNIEKMLEPNKMATFSKDAGSLTVKDVEPENFLGWINYNFLYDNVSIIDVLDDISSWYGVKFINEYTDIDKFEVSINVSRDIKLLDLLSRIEQIYDIVFINEGHNTFSVIKKN